MQTITTTLSFIIDPANNSLPFDDSSLAPIEYADLCKLPVGTVYNVRNYGAKGDGIADDTPAIKQILAAIKASNTKGIIYFPMGIYNVCPQPGDTTPWGNAVFNMALFPMQIVFIGDGPTKTFLKGFMPGLKDPKTTWDTISTTFQPQISRFFMFQAITSPNTPAGGFQIRSMTVDGQAGFTGNFVSGGNYLTGDGWDWNHKCVRVDGSSSVGPVLIFNANLINWRGEIVYSGGTAAQNITLIKAFIDSTNASAVSCSTDMLIAYSIVGPNTNTNNGVENFCILNTQKFIARKSSFGAKNNAVVYIGVPGASCFIDDCDIHDSSSGLLFSEEAWNVTVQNSRFTNLGKGIITSILGLYPAFPTGFGTFNITNNISTRGYLLTLQNPVDKLVVSNNTIQTNGALIDGPFPASQWASKTPMVVRDNIIGLGCSDIGGNYAGQFTPAVGLWSGTQHPSSVPPFYSIGYKYDDFGTRTSGTISPKTDWTNLNDNENNLTVKVPYLIDITPQTMAGIPIGYTTSFRIGKNNWVLRANSAWNTFPADVPVTNNMKIRMNTNRLFELVS